MKTIPPSNIKEIKDDWRDGFVEGYKVATERILKLIEENKFDKNNIAIKEFKEELKKEIEGDDDR